MLLALLAWPAAAQDEKAPPPAAPVVKGNNESGPPAAATGKTEADKEKAEPAEKKSSGEDSGEKTAPDDGTFIDRDGDGIQDGKEHRFRGKHRQHDRKNPHGEQGEEAKIRHRQQNGRR